MISTNQKIHPTFLTTFDLSIDLCLDKLKQLKECFAKSAYYKTNLTLFKRASN